MVLLVREGGEQRARAGRDRGDGGRGTVRNQKQETVLSVQFVPRMRLLEFGFALCTARSTPLSCYAMGGTLVGSAACCATGSVCNVRYACTVLSWY
eukprot:3933897-Rhodomonas_salina.11